MAGDNEAGGDRNKPEELRIGVYICHCGSNIADVIIPSKAGERSSNEGGRK
jgi:hypothetical protein